MGLNWLEKPQSIFMILVFIFLQFFSGWVNGKVDIAITSNEFKDIPTKLLYFKDSETILYLESETKFLYRSEDEGKSWKQVKEIPKGKALRLHRHPFDNKKAILSTSEKDHYATQDRGRTWVKFNMPLIPSTESKIFSFHSTESDYIIYIGSKCTTSSFFGFGEICVDSAYYTLDFFKTSKHLVSNIASCEWALSTLNGELKKLNKNTVFCILSNGESLNVDKILEDSKLVWSTDFFKSKTVVDFDFDGVPDGGVIGFTMLQSFMVAAARMNVRSDKLSLFVSRDGKIWAEAHIPQHKSLTQNAFTFLESTSNSIAIDVVFSSDSEIGNLYFSNSNGTYFTESLKNTNRDLSGIVDFERLKGLENIILSNVVRNSQDFKDVLMSSKKLQTYMTFNSGGKWDLIQPPKKNCKGKLYECIANKKGIKGCSLHLHSISGHTNMGPVFSRLSAPGILFGVGNVGSYLKDREDGDTFYSKDGGLTWSCARSGPHKYILADMGSIVVLAEEKKDIERLIYSYDQGDHWNEVKLPNKIKPLYLTTDDSASSQSILLVAVNSDDSANVIHLDFSKIHERQCEFNAKKPKSSKDIEIWQPKAPSSSSKNSNELCMNGKKMSFYRRKPDVECYMGLKFDLPKPQEEACACSEADFECDYNFGLNEKGKCVLEGKLVVPEGECKKKTGTFMGSSGYRKIPGNECDLNLKGSINLAKKVERPCNEIEEIPSKPNNAKIKRQRKEFDSSIVDYFIFKESEAYMVFTLNGELWTSIDGGASWKKKFDSKIIKIIGHTYDKSTAFVITSDQKLMVTKNQGRSFNEIKLPMPISILKLDPILSFHPDKKDALLFVGGTSCPKCYSEAFISFDNGEKWNSIRKYVKKCQFTKTNEFEPKNGIDILCSVYKDPKPDFDQSKAQLGNPNDFPLDLIGYKLDDFSKRSVFISNVGEFYISGEYAIVSTTKDSKITLNISKSDFKFIEAQFPPDMVIASDSFSIYEHQHSDANRIMVTLSKVTFENKDQPTFGISQLPIGTLFISNGNGTSYSISLPDLRVRNSGLVDMEEVAGIRGLMIANQVTSIDSNSNPIAKTVMSYDNGATWNYIKPPTKRVNGKSIECREGRCSLHLHTIYENHQRFNSFGNVNSQGRLIGVGNVGQYLLPYEDCSTFASTDNGLSWHEVKSTETLYAINDSGNLMVLVSDEIPTTSLSYSTDGGESWNDYQFTNQPIRASNLVTSSEGDSSRFMIFGFSVEKNGPNSPGLPTSQIITVDFEGLYDGVCKFDKKSNGDFVKWTANRVIGYKDGEQKTTECLLGSKLTFWRKKADAMCYIGKSHPSQSVNIESCECTELDFECENNYWRSDFASGECRLIGVDEDRPKDCKLGQKYKAKSGYRRIASSHCKNGVDLTKPIQKECLEIEGIEINQTVFESDMVDNFYFRESNTLIIRTEDGEVHVSKNEGYSFEKLIKEDHPKIISALHHPYIDDTAYFVTLSKTHYFTHDETRTLNSFNTPSTPNIFEIPIFTFHGEEPMWSIFTGAKDCEKVLSDKCRAEAFVSQDNGNTWNSIGDYVRNCYFARTKYITNVPKQRIVCEVYKNKMGSQSRFLNNPVELIYSDDWFETKKKVLDDVVGFSYFYEYTVAASNSKDKSNEMELNVSLDTISYNSVKLPDNITISNSGFTVLESDTHELFLHITTEAKLNHGYGPLLISDRNGTRFKLSLTYLNRDDDGFVDFEKMAGVEGIALANQVTNPNEVGFTKLKKLQSLITFDNGLTWNLIQVKGKDNQNGKYGLHLHSFTERSDPENIFSIPTAVGMMIGVGNYGTELTSYKKGNVYLTTNAGKYWTEIAQGPHRHEFGDSGGLILLVEDGPYVNEVKYSSDMGGEFKKLKFPKSIKAIKVRETSIDPMSTSTKFLIFGNTKSDDFAVTYINFGNLYQTKCQHDPLDPKKSDFESWSPVTDKGQKCYFGRELSFLRRKPNAKCIVGTKFEVPKKEEKVCPCTMDDFECDFGFVNKAGTCVLEDKTLSPDKQCEKGVTFYTAYSGYRKKSLSKCNGGINMANDKEVWCPGHGLSGTSIFFIVVIPLAGLGIILYAFIKRGSNTRRINWSQLYNSLSPYLCFVPALIVELIYGHRSSPFSFGQRFGYSNEGYEPVTQYDYEFELEEDFIDGPTEVVLDSELARLSDDDLEDAYGEFVGVDQQKDDLDDI